MHPNLANHLHTQECNVLIEEYKKCVEENKYKRYLGTCADIQNKMETCIQNELKKRRAQGGEDRRQKEIDHYVKQNPKLAEKIKLLEQLKAEKEQKERQK